MTLVTVVADSDWQNGYMGRALALIADDDEPSRYVLRRIVEGECDVICETENGQEAVSAAERLRPDVAVLDISMPVMGGFEAARRMQATVPATRIIFASHHTDRAYVEEAFRIGAKGFVVKRAATKELPEALREVLAGRTFQSRLAGTSPYR